MHSRMIICLKPPQNLVLQKHSITRGICSAPSPHPPNTPPPCAEWKSEAMLEGPFGPYQLCCLPAAILCLRKSSPLSVSLLCIAEQVSRNAAVLFWGAGVGENAGDQTQVLIHVDLVFYHWATSLALTGLQSPCLWPSIVDYTQFYGRLSKTFVIFRNTPGDADGIFLKNWLGKPCDHRRKWFWTFCLVMALKAVCLLTSSSLFLSLHFLGSSLPVLELTLRVLQTCWD